jgi:cytochrome c biogenesis protein CcmG/thiol:disulfide interchange protein DsbE
MKNIFLALTLAAVGLVKAQDAVPSVAVKNINNENINFTQVVEADKITVISFWATWCGPCIKELQAIDQHYSEWQEKYNMKLVAVSIDDARNVKKVKPKVLGEGWTYEIILDENQDLARAMNVNNPPMTFIVDQTGKIVYSHQGYTPGAEDELEERLQELAEVK